MKKRSKKKAVELKFSTIGVRFLFGPNLAKVYTYKVRAGVKVRLGQELVADTPRGAAIVVVVRIDGPKVPVKHVLDDNFMPLELKFIERKVAPL